MQHLLQISRKVDYGLRAMIHLAALPEGVREPQQEIAARYDIPREFLAKILKTLADRGLVSALRGPRGGVALARPADRISFLDVIEAVDGPVVMNLCLDETQGCSQGATCTMQSVWRAGQERMLDVYRTTTLADLVPRAESAPVPLHHGNVALPLGPTPHP
jgi:Rrf2 family protein